MVQEFWINIAAGVFLAAVTRILLRWLLPYYFGWRYKAPRLEGKWSVHDSQEAAGPAVGTANIDQRGENVRVLAGRSTSRSGKAIAREFKYLGKVRDGQVLLTFEEPSSSGFISGCVVLNISGDLKALSGYTVYLDRDAGKVVAHPIFYRRRQ